VFWGVKLHFLIVDNIDFLFSVLLLIAIILILFFVDNPILSVCMYDGVGAVFLSF